MKHLKIFENYQTRAQVAKICKQYGIENWSINQDGLVDVDGDVNLSLKKLTKLPLKFGKISGSFYCQRSNLITLEGAPISVSGGFFCHDNGLTTLEGAPKSVRDFNCSYNELTTLEGAPESVSGDFYCDYNQLTTLEGAPKLVDGSFYCDYNKLVTLEGAPESVGGNFNCNNNKLTTLEGAPYSVSSRFYCYGNPLPDLIKNNIKSIKHILANQHIYHIYNKDGTINEYRFQLMMDSMD